MLGAGWAAGTLIAATGAGAAGGAVGATAAGAGATADADGGAVAGGFGACFCTFFIGLGLLASRPDGGLDFGAGLGVVLGVGCFGDGRVCSMGGFARPKGTWLGFGWGTLIPIPISGKGATGLFSTLGAGRLGNDGPPTAIMGAIGAEGTIGAEG